MKNLKKNVIFHGVRIILRTTVDEKTPNISLFTLFNNSKKLVQIPEFSQQIVEGYEFMLAKTVSVIQNLRFKLH